MYFVNAYIYIYHILLSYWSADGHELFPLFGHLNNAAMNDKYLFGSLLSILSSMYLGVELLDHMVILCLIFWVADKTCHSDCAILHFCKQCTRVSLFRILTNTCFPSLDDSCLNECEVISQCRLICFSLNTDGVEHIFMYLLIIYVSSLEKCLFWSFVHFWIELFAFVVAGVLCII